MVVSALGVTTVCGVFIFLRGFFQFDRVGFRLVLLFSLARKQVLQLRLKAILGIDPCLGGFLIWVLGLVRGYCFDVCKHNTVHIFDQYFIYICFVQVALSLYQVEYHLYSFLIYFCLSNKKNWHCPSLLIKYPCMVEVSFSIFFFLIFYQQFTSKVLRQFFFYNRRF